MPNFSGRAEKRLQGRLDPGEDFVFAAVAQPQGSTSRINATGRAHWVARQEADADRRAAAAGGRLATRVPSSNGYLSVTTRRLIWLAQGGSGFPTDTVVVEFSADEIAEVRSAKAGRMGQRAVTLVFADGSAAELWVHRSNKPDQLVAAIGELIQR